MSDDDRAIYDQDCEFYRHQDNLMWSRLKTGAVIEGGMIYGVFSSAIFGPREKFGLAVFGSLMILILGRIAMRDAYFSRGHMERIRGFEQRANRPFNRALRWRGFGGHTLLNVLLTLVFVGNLIIIFKAIHGILH